MLAKLLCTKRKSASAPRCLRCLGATIDIVNSITRTANSSSHGGIFASMFTKGQHRGHGDHWPWRLTGNCWGFANIFKLHEIDGFCLATLCTYQGALATFIRIYLLDVHGDISFPKVRISHLCHAGCGMLHVPLVTLCTNYGPPQSSHVHGQRATHEEEQWQRHFRQDDPRPAHEPLHHGGGVEKPPGHTVQRIEVHRGGGGRVEDAPPLIADQPHPHEHRQEPEQPHGIAEIDTHQHRSLSRVVPSSARVRDDSGLGSYSPDCS